MTNSAIKWTTKFDLSRRYRIRTRKRFVKLLMAEGISRNDANMEAKTVQDMNKLGWAPVSYQSFYLLSRLCGVFDESEEGENNA